MTAGIEAAVRTARALGLKVEDPHLIQETNNTVVWLRPYPIIAKVGTHDYSATTLDYEHEVALSLTKLGAAIAPPWRDVGLITDPETKYVISLWSRQDVEGGAHEGDVGRSLKLLHAAMARTNLQLHSFRDGIAHAQSVLAKNAPMVALEHEDLQFLRRSFAELERRLDGYTFAEQGLHGEPHGGNYLSTPAGIRWIDFEGACSGPLEWDLAFLSVEARAQFEHVDHSLLELLMSLNSARVATWCWVQARFPEMRQHGQHHLSLLRSRLP